MTDNGIAQMIRKRGRENGWLARPTARGHRRGEMT
jgi:hypothetical protein